MKTLKKLKLNQLNQAEIEDRAMNMLRGGGICGCACIQYDTERNLFDNYSSGHPYPPAPNMPYGPLL